MLGKHTTRNICRDIQNILPNTRLQIWLVDDQYFTEHNKNTDFKRGVFCKCVMINNTKIEQDFEPVASS